MQVYLTTMEFNDTDEKINKQKLNNGMLKMVQIGSICTILSMPN
jgi:hypothetical protein